MILDEDVNDFLEHHGIRGMKWGVRKQRSESEVAARNKKIKKVAAATAIGAAVAGGLVFASRNQKVKTFFKTSVAQKFTKKGQIASKKIVNRSGSDSFGSINNLRAETRAKRSSEHATQMRKIATRNLEITAKMNADLMQGYRSLGTPFHQRELLDMSHWERLSR